jgi:hypothetical protein
MGKYTGPTNVALPNSRSLSMSHVWQEGHHIEDWLRVPTSNFERHYA